eukprot:scaffold259865_cov18-Tisochrysis_lutea.AAC.2
MGISDGGSGSAKTVVWVEDGATVVVSGVNIDADRRWRHAGGPEDWRVRFCVHLCPCPVCMCVCAPVVFIGLYHFLILLWRKEEARRSKGQRGSKGHQSSFP